MLINIGDTISWNSTYKGLHKIREGIVLEIIPALKNPKLYVDKFENKYNIRNVIRLNDSKVEADISYLVSYHDIIYWVKVEQILNVIKSPSTKKIILIYEYNKGLKNNRFNVLIHVFICFRLLRIFKVLSKKGYCVISANSILACTGGAEEDIIPLLKNVDACLLINVENNLFYEYNLSIKKLIFTSFSDLVQDTWFMANSWINTNDGNNT